LSRDQKFFDMYSLVIGVLIALALVIFIFSAKISDLTQGVYTRDVAEYQAELAERIRPVGQVYLAGEEQQSSAPVVEVPAEPEPVATAMSGPQVSLKAQTHSNSMLCKVSAVASATCHRRAAVLTSQMPKSRPLSITWSANLSN